MHLYPYLGPPGLSTLTERWRAVASSQSGTFTYIVSQNGVLWLADQHSEHVSCARGEAVQAAGELTLERGAVSAVSNLSTGYCPDPGCWPTVREALERAGFTTPPTFTHAYLFAICSSCGQRNVIKDEIFECAVCGTELRRLGEPAQQAHDPERE